MTPALPHVFLATVVGTSGTGKERPTAHMRNSPHSGGGLHNA
jgi:hypothetical protein